MTIGPFAQDEIRSGRLVQPFILRRMKTDRSIISDLPEKIELKAYCGLTKRQATIYAKLTDQLAKMLKTPIEVLPDALVEAWPARTSGEAWAAAPVRPALTPAAVPLPLPPSRPSPAALP